MAVPVAAPPPLALNRPIGAANRGKGALVFPLIEEPDGTISDGKHLYPTIAPPVYNKTNITLPYYIPKDSFTRLIRAWPTFWACHPDVGIVTGSSQQTSEWIASQIFSYVSGLQSFNAHRLTAPNGARWVQVYSNNRTVWQLATATLNIPNSGVALFDVGLPHCVTYVDKPHHGCDPATCSFNHGPHSLPPGPVPLWTVNTSGQPTRDVLFLDVNIPHEPEDFFSPQRQALGPPTLATSNFTIVRYDYEGKFHPPLQTCATQIDHPSRQMAYRLCPGSLISPPTYERIDTDGRNTQHNAVDWLWAGAYSDGIHHWAWECTPVGDGWVIYTGGPVPNRPQQTHATHSLMSDLPKGPRNKYYTKGPDKTMLFQDTVQLGSTWWWWFSQASMPIHLPKQLLDELSANFTGKPRDQYSFQSATRIIKSCLAKMSVGPIGSLCFPGAQPSLHEIHQAILKHIFVDTLPAELEAAETADAATDQTFWEWLIGRRGKRQRLREAREFNDKTWWERNTSDSYGAPVLAALGVSCVFYYSRTKLGQKPKVSKQANLLAATQELVGTISPTIFKITRQMVDKIHQEVANLVKPLGIDEVSRSFNILVNSQAVPSEAFLQACILAPLWEEKVKQWGFPLEEVELVQYVFNMPDVAINEDCYDNYHHYLNGRMQAYLLHKCTRLLGRQSYWTAVITHAFWNYWAIKDGIAFGMKEGLIAGETISGNAVTQDLPQIKGIAMMNGTLPLSTAALAVACSVVFISSTAIGQRCFNWAAKKLTRAAKAGWRWVRRCYRKRPVGQNRAPADHPKDHLLRAVHYDMLEGEDDRVLVDLHTHRLTSSKDTPGALLDVLTLTDPATGLALDAYELPERQDDATTTKDYFNILMRTIRESKQQYNQVLQQQGFRRLRTPPVVTGSHIPARHVFCSLRLQDCQCNISPQDATTYQESCKGLLRLPKALRLAAAQIATGTYFKEKLSQEETKDLLTSITDHLSAQYLLLPHRCDTSKLFTKNDKRLPTLLVSQHLDKPNVASAESKLFVPVGNDQEDDEKRTVAASVAVTFSTTMTLPTPDPAGETASLLNRLCVCVPASSNWYGFRPINWKICGARISFFRAVSPRLFSLKGDYCGVAYDMTNPKDHVVPFSEWITRYPECTRKRYYTAREGLVHFLPTDIQGDKSRTCFMKRELLGKLVDTPGGVMVGPASARSVVNIQDASMVITGPFFASMGKCLAVVCNPDQWLCYIGGHEPAEVADALTANLAGALVAANLDASKMEAHHNFASQMDHKTLMSHFGATAEQLACIDLWAKMRIRTVHDASYSPSYTMSSGQPNTTVCNTPTLPVIIAFEFCQHLVDHHDYKSYDSAMEELMTHSVVLHNGRNWRQYKHFKIVCMGDDNLIIARSEVAKYVLSQITFEDHGFEVTMHTVPAQEYGFLKFCSSKLYPAISHTGSAVLRFAPCAGKFLIKTGWVCNHQIITAIFTQGSIASDIYLRGVVIGVGATVSHVPALSALTNCIARCSELPTDMVVRGMPIQPYQLRTNVSSYPNDTSVDVTIGGHVVHIPSSAEFFDKYYGVDEKQMAALVSALAAVSRLPAYVSDPELNLVVTRMAQVDEVFLMSSSTLKTLNRPTSSSNGLVAVVTKESRVKDDSQLTILHPEDDDYDSASDCGSGATDDGSYQPDHKLASRGRSPPRSLEFKLPPPDTSRGNSTEINFIYYNRPDNGNGASMIRTLGQIRLPKERKIVHFFNPCHMFLQPGSRAMQGKISKILLAGKDAETHVLTTVTLNVHANNDPDLVLDTGEIDPRTKKPVRNFAPQNAQALADMFDLIPAATPIYRLEQGGVPHTSIDFSGRFFFVTGHETRGFNHPCLTSSRVIPVSVAGFNEDTSASGLNAAAATTAFLSHVAANADTTPDDSERAIEFPLGDANPTRTRHYIYNWFAASQKLKHTQGKRIQDPYLDKDFLPTDSEPSSPRSAHSELIAAHEDKYDPDATVYEYRTVPTKPSQGGPYQRPPLALAPTHHPTATTSQPPRPNRLQQRKKQNYQTKPKKQWQARQKGQKGNSGDLGDLGPTACPLSTRLTDLLVVFCALCLYSLYATIVRAIATYTIHIKPRRVHDEQQRRKPSRSPSPHRPPHEYGLQGSVGQVGDKGPVSQIVCDNGVTALSTFLLSCLSILLALVLATVCRALHTPTITALQRAVLSLSATDPQSFALYKHFEIDPLHMSYYGVAYNASHAQYVNSTNSNCCGHMLNKFRYRRQLDHLLRKYALLHGHEDIYTTHLGPIF